MYSRRQLKMGSVIQKAFAEILSRDGKAIYGKAFVTVTNTKVTPDLSLVRFYISIFNAEDGEEVIRRFNEHKFELKRKLAEKLRHQMRVMPEIEFFRDETLDYAFHMDEVFAKIKADEETLKAEIEEAEARKKKAVALSKKKPAKTKAVKKKAKK
jgi:ribosome-binding factor A